MKTYWIVSELNYDFPVEAYGLADAYWKAHEAFEILMIDRLFDIYED